MIVAVYSIDWKLRRRKNFVFALLISLVVVSFEHSYTDADCNHDELTVVISITRLIFYCIELFLFWLDSIEFRRKTII